MSIKESYKKARKNLLGRVRYAAKKGIEFAKSLIPAIPKKPTKASIDRLNRMDAGYIAKHALPESAPVADIKTVKRGKTKPGNAKPGPKTKEFQAEYNKEVKRIKRYIKEQAKKGIIIDYTPPETPANISPAKLRELRELTPKKLTARYGYKLNQETGELAEIKRPVKGSLVQRAKGIVSDAGERSEKRMKNIERINAEAEKRRVKNERKKAAKKAKEAAQAVKESSVGASAKADDSAKTLARKYLDDVLKLNRLNAALAAGEESEKATGIKMPEGWRGMVQNEIELVGAEMNNFFPNKLSGNDAIAAAIRELPTYESQAAALRQFLGDFEQKYPETDKQYLERMYTELRIQGLEKPGAYRPNIHPVKYLRQLTDDETAKGGVVLEGLEQSEREQIADLLHFGEERVTVDDVMRVIDANRDVLYKDGKPLVQFQPELSANDELLRRRIAEMGDAGRADFIRWVEESAQGQRDFKQHIEKSKREIQREKNLHIFDNVEAVTDRLNDIINGIDDENAKAQAAQLLEIWNSTLAKYSHDELDEYIRENEYDLFESLDEVIDVQELYKFLVSLGMGGMSAYDEALKLSRAAKLLNFGESLGLSDAAKRALQQNNESPFDALLRENNTKGYFSRLSIDLHAFGEMARRKKIPLRSETVESFREWKNAYSTYSPAQKKVFADEHGEDMNIVMERLMREIQAGSLTEKTQDEFNMLTDFLLDTAE